MNKLEITVSDRVYKALETIALRLGKSIETIAECFVRDGAFSYEDDCSAEFKNTFRQ